MLLFLSIVLFLSQGNLRRCLTQQADVRVQLYEVKFSYSIHTVWLVAPLDVHDYHFNSV